MFTDPKASGEPPSHWRQWLVPQDWHRFSADDHAVWDLLYARQVALVRDRIVKPFRDGLERLDLGAGGIPDLEALSDRLEPLTGWRLVSVAGIVPDDAFFAMLRDRRFPVGNFIRPRASLDYLEEPDCFHDIFGHVPMLADPAMARLMEAMGRLGVEAVAAGHGDIISRLYWYSVEFGLAEEDGERRLLGAGLASSFGEARVALEADVPRLPFTIARAAATPYRNDCMQPLYFVTHCLGETAAILEGLDAAKLADLSDA